MWLGAPGINTIGIYSKYFSTLITGSSWVWVEGYNRNNLERRKGLCFKQDEFSMTISGTLYVRNSTTNNFLNHVS